MQAISINDHPVVRVSEGAVVIEGLVDDDPLLVAVVSEDPDPEGAVRACLGLGARVSKAARATLDTEVVDRAFAELTNGFSRTVGEAVDEIIGKTDSLVDAEDGALPSMLRQLRSDLTSQFDALFDEDSKTSALARMEKVFSASAVTFDRTMRAALDPSNDESPLAQWKREVLAQLTESLGLVLTQITDLRTALVADETRATTFELTAVKGFPFEDRVHSAIEGFARRYGDLAEHVGTIRGAGAAKTGDSVVELSVDDTGGRRAAVAFEAKKDKLSLRKTHLELDRALTNRDAVVAVAVFASPELAPTSVPFSFHANKAIVVLDPETGDTQTLELAYMWARWEARKSLIDDTAGVDIARVEAAFADAQRALARSSTLRGCHTRAKRQIDLATGELEVLVAEVNTAVAALRLALGG